MSCDHSFLSYRMNQFRHVPLQQVSRLLKLKGPPRRLNPYLHWLLKGRPMAYLQEVVQEL